MRDGKVDQPRRRFAVAHDNGLRSAMSVADQQLQGVIKDRLCLGLCPGRDMGAAGGPAEDDVLSVGLAIRSPGSPLATDSHAPGSMH